MSGNNRVDILYVDNFSNFDLFIELAVRSPLSWFFIVYSRDKAVVCKRRGVRFFLMPRNSGLWRSHSLLLPVKAVDDSISRDRILRYFPRFVARNIIARQLKEFVEIVDNVKPLLVLGEISWANEHVFYNWCEANGFCYRHVLNLPLERNRVVLFDDEHSFSSLADNPSDIPGDVVDSISYYELCQRLRKHNSKATYSLASSIKNLVNVEAQLRDYRSISLYYKIHGAAKIAYRLLCRALKLSKGYCDSLDQLKRRADGRRIVYMPLHIQPESTPDYVTRGTNDQFALAGEILDVLPDDCILVMKDHPNAFSLRNPFTLYSLMQKKNFVYLDRSVSSAGVIEVSHAVATVAGTAALEALNVGVRAMIFSNIFYSKSAYIYPIKSCSEIPAVLDEVIQSPVHNDLELSSYGVTAFVHDPSIFPDVLGEVNLATINRLLSRFVSKVDNAV